MDDLRTMLGSAWRRFGATLLLGALAVALFALPPATRWLQFDVASVEAGQWWRIVTGHWTHWSADHLLWDVLAFVILAGAAERFSRGWMLAIVGISAIVISAAVWLLAPSISTYRGLSGIDSALFVAVTTLWLTERLRDRDPIGAVVMAGAIVGFVGKTLYETTTGATLFVDTSTADMIPVALAHLGGALVGGLAAVTADARASREAQPKARRGVGITRDRPRYAREPGEKRLVVADE
ncbi:MAG: rhombosortase [Planctomycetes bacterium]|nr:rhombosortase [Planctomycetota bacterium]